SRERCGRVEHLMPPEKWLAIRSRLKVCRPSGSRSFLVPVGTRAHRRASIYGDVRRTDAVGMIFRSGFRRGPMRRDKAALSGQRLQSVHGISGTGYGISENVMRILLVEDDQMIGKTLQQALRQDRYAVDWVTDGVAGKTAVDTGSEAYAMILLDLGLPKKSGLDLLKEIRRAGNKGRVLILTARDAVSDRVAGLDAGADDYLTK